MSANSHKRTYSHESKKSEIVQKWAVRTPLKLAIRALDALRFSDVASACTEISAFPYRRVVRVRLLRQPRLAQGFQLRTTHELDWV